MLARYLTPRFAAVRTRGWPAQPSRAAWRGVAIHVGALAGVIIATVLTGLIDGIVGPYAVFLFFSAVVFASASLSLSAGLFATATSTVAAFFFFFQPEQTWQVTWTSGSLCGLFAIMNASITLITAYLRGPAFARAAPLAPMPNEDELLDRSSQLLGMVSHELRNRLAAMSMSSDLLLKQGKRLGEQDTEAIIEEIRSDVDRLQMVFDNLLALSKLGSGHGPEMERCSLGPFGRDLIARMSRRLEGLEVAVAIDPELPLVSAVPTYLEQILRNLLINAKKYGGGRQPVELRTWYTAQEVCISVRDHGVAAERK